MYLHWLPLILLAIFVLLFGVECPYWDQWQLIDELDRFSDRGWSLSELWSQHNEHRLFFPKLIMHTLTALGGWSVRVEMLVTVGLYIVAFMGLRRLLHLDARPPLQQLCCVLLFFSTHHWQNWLWGFQIQILLCVAGSVWALQLMTRGRPSLPGAAALSVVASGSFLIGFLLWPLGLVVWTHRWLQGRSSGRQALTWAAASLAVLALHFSTGASGTRGDEAALVPLAYASFVAALLGMGALGIGLVAPTIALGLGLVLGSALGLRRGWIRPSAGSIALGSFGLLAVFAIGLGRSHSGVEGALMSRYTTFTCLPWLAMVAALPRELFLWRPLRTLTPIATASALAIVVWQGAGIHRALRFTEQLERGRIALLSGRGLTHECLGAFAIELEALGRRVEVLRERRWSLFRALDFEGQNERKAFRLQTKLLAGTSTVQLMGTQGPRDTAVFVYLRNGPESREALLVDSDQKGRFELRFPRADRLVCDCIWVQPNGHLGRSEVALP